MKSSTTFILTLIVSCLFLQHGYAVEEEIIADIGGRPVTNIEVLENVAIEYEQDNPRNESTSKLHVYQGTIKKMLPIILFEQYAAKNNIKITEQEVMGLLTEAANKRGRTLTEDIQDRKTVFEDFENARKRSYKVWYDYLLARKVVEHFNPDVNTVTEEDIQKWIKYRKTFHAPMGEPERIQYQGIAVLASDYADNSSIREELGKIKKGINEGESFETIANDYSGRKGYHAGIGHQPTDRVMTSMFKKQGLDALTPWSLLKGKAVVVEVKDLHIVMVMKVEDYLPDTQMSIEAAVNDKNMRQECIDKARGYKFHIQKRDLVEILRRGMGGIEYRGNEEEICKKLVDQYKIFRAETRENDPNSTK